MNEPEFILQALFFIVNSLAVVIIIAIVYVKMKWMEAKLDYTIGLLRSMSLRNDISYIFTLDRILAQLVKEERYEEAVRLKKIIEENIKWIDEEWERRK